jgi:DNA-binding response OmpR family regulator
MARVLIVEDDASVGRSLAAALEADRFPVEWVTSAAGAIEAVTREAPIVVLLDLGLPDADGVDLCRHLRELAPEARVVMLTARREEIDVVVGLDAGADDYIVKPFRLAELLARLRAHMRRSTEDRGTRIVVGDVDLDLGARRAYAAGVEVDLRPKEFDLLALLARERGRVVTREDIMSEVWDEHWFGSTKTLDMHISALRKKLSRAQARITTLRHVGYRLDE